MDRAASTAAGRHARPPAVDAVSRSEPGEDARIAPRRRFRSLLSFIIGALLLAAAVSVAARSGDAWESAWRALRHASPWFAVLLAATCAVNLALTGSFFSILMKPHGTVGRGEMMAVIASASLLNYLPLRPGLVGRVAYHSTVNGIPVATCIRVFMLAAALSATLALTVLLTVLASGALGIPAYVGAIAPAPILLITAAASAPARRPALALLLRHAELLLWAVRYWAAFALLGRDLSAAAAVEMACVSAVVTMVPFVSNGLGLREWAIGLLSPQWAGTELALGVSAELLNRASEVLVALVSGIPATIWLLRRRASAAEAEGRGAQSACAEAGSG